MSGKGGPYFAGRKHTEESKRKTSETMKRVWQSPELRKNASLKHKGKKLTDEHKYQNSIAMKKIWSNPEFKEQRSELFKGERNPAWRGGISKDRKHVRELQRQINQRYKANKKGVGGSFTLQEWRELKSQYGNACPICKRKEPEIILTVDHVIPVSKGGNSSIQNIQPLCKKCNQSKSNKVKRITSNGELLLF